MNTRNCLLIACLCLYAGGSWAALAGTVEFATGEASIRNANGQSRPAAAGGGVSSGDSIETAQGRVQLRMVDGAYISLQPQTQLRVDEYRMGSAANPAEERGFLSLVRGGMRTITGAIGHLNRDNYKLSTSTATIGIRGTEFAVVANEGTRVNVIEGGIALCNNGGCVDIGAGQSGFAPPTGSRPALTFAPARLAPAASSTPPSTPVAAEQPNASGASNVLAQAVASASPNVVPLPNGTGTLLAAANVAGAGGSFSAGVLGGTLTYTTPGALQQFVDGSTPTNDFAGGASTDFGADGIIAWGRWTSGGTGVGGQNLATMNYIATTSSPVTATNITGTYNVFASTAPVAVDSAGVVTTGAANSVTGSLTANFNNWAGGGGTLTYALHIPLAGQTFDINGSASQLNQGTAFLGSGQASITSTGAGCTPSCAGNIPFGDAIQGVFTGANAERAGVNYGFTSQIGQITGAAVLKK